MGLWLVKLNATSDTAPYRHKKKAFPTDDNVNYFSLEMEDATYQENDIPGENPHGCVFSYLYEITHKQINEGGKLVLEMTDEVK